MFTHHLISMQLTMTGKFCYEDRQFLATDERLVW